MSDYTSLINSTISQSKNLSELKGPELNVALNSIFTIINTVCDRNPLLFSDKNRFYYIKSFLILFLNFNNYKSLNNGTLKSNSVNCKYTISTIDNAKNNQELLFIKVVDVDFTGDKIIIDIISCILFEHIYKIIELNHTERNPNILTDLSDYVAIFKGAFSSYSISNKWDYNNLSRIYKTSECRILETYQLNELIPSHIYITNGIINPETIDIMIYDYASSISNEIERERIKTLIVNYYLAVPNIFNFIYYYGSHFGFLHNDLHYKNLLFDQSKNKLIMIDYGRNYFGYFYDNEYQDNEINERVKDYVNILNYQGGDQRYTAPVRSYKQMIDRYGNSRNIKSQIKSLFNDTYLTYILDLITLSITLLYYFEMLILLDPRSYSDKTNEFIYHSLLIDLIYFESNPSHRLSNRLNILQNKNFSIKARFNTYDEIVNKYIETKSLLISLVTSNPSALWMAYVYDGLFYTALMLNFFNLNGDYLYQSDSNGFANLFYKKSFILRGRLINQRSINNFMQFLQTIHARYSDKLKYVNLFFYKLAKPSEIYNGGKNSNYDDKTIFKEFDNLSIDELSKIFYKNTKDKPLLNKDMETIIRNMNKKKESDGLEKTTDFNINQYFEMMNMTVDDEFKNKMHDELQKNKKLVNDDDILNIQHNIKKSRSSSKKDVVYNDNNPIDLDLQMEKYEKIFS